MILLVLFLFAVVTAIGAGCLAAYKDLYTLTIPNYCNLLIAASFAIIGPIIWLTVPEGEVFAPWWSHFISFAVIFLSTLFFFIKGWLGGGDAKMASAFSLWFGLRELVIFLFFMALMGAILSAVALISKKFALGRHIPGQWGRALEGGESKLPYGIAILFGAVMAFLDLGYFDVMALGRIFLDAIS